MHIHFTKMHGLGNDFMIIDGVRQNFQPNSELIRQWANRRTGIGFDQLLLVEPARHSSADFFYRIFNADGSEVAQCGNGARCLARFLHDERLTSKNPILVETLAGILELKIENNRQITVNMGIPIFEPKQIPFLTEKQEIFYPIEVQKETLTIQALSLGNPHCILTVSHRDNTTLDKLGSQLSHHPRFPERTNVEFMEIINRQQIRLRVYERGVGETLACGSGACAAVVAGRLNNLLDEIVEIEQSGGRLTVMWQDNKSPVFLTGPAVFVFKGKVDGG